MCWAVLNLGRSEAAKGHGAIGHVITTREGMGSRKLLSACLRRDPPAKIGQANFGKGGGGSRREERQVTLGKIKASIGASIPPGGIKGKSDPNVGTPLHASSAVC